MLREGEKEGKTSWSGGPVHFFCYSFDRLFRKLFRKADTVVGGGPWNEDTSAAGIWRKKTASRSDAVAGSDDHDEIRTLKRGVRVPEGRPTRSTGKHGRLWNLWAGNWPSRTPCPWTHAGTVADLSSVER